MRIARILAGEGTGQFSSKEPAPSVVNQRTVPLSVALDYVGSILDESRKEITRLKVCSCRSLLFLACSDRDLTSGTV